eukprot:Amastigsp_a677422_38.p1 type:complete len:180 gc:universal Amastigsp_a677422_38:27-566(+)
MSASESDVSLSEDLRTPSDSSTSETLIEYPLCFRCCISRRQRVRHERNVIAQRRRRAMRAGRPDPYPRVDGAMACCERRCPSYCVVASCCKAAPLPQPAVERNKVKREAQWNECDYSPQPLDYSASSTEWDLVRRLQEEVKREEPVKAKGGKGKGAGQASLHTSFAYGAHTSAHAGTRY